MLASAAEEIVTEKNSKPGFIPPAQPKPAEKSGIPPAVKKAVQPDYVNLTKKPAVLSDYVNESIAGAVVIAAPEQAAAPATQNSTPVPAVRPLSVAMLPPVGTAPTIRPLSAALLPPVTSAGSCPCTYDDNNFTRSFKYFSLWMLRPSSRFVLTRLTQVPPPSSPLPVHPMRHHVAPRRPWHHHCRPWPSR